MGLVADARSTVGGVLSTVADVTVWPWPKAVDQPAGRTVVLVVDSVAPADVACPDTRVTVTAYLFTGLTADGPAWDALDALLDDALEAIDGQRACRWTNVDTALYRDTHPAYRLTIEV